MPASHLISMPPHVFSSLREYIQKLCGVSISIEKKTMLEARIQKRLKTLKLPSYDAYCNYLFSPVGQNQELEVFIDLVTTHKTYFFRESHHFDFLTKIALPQLIKETDGAYQLKVWSVGCSTGQEPYTVAMVISEFIRARNLKNFNYSILGTDISEYVLLEAQRGIYLEEQITEIPMDLRMRYLLQSKDRTNKRIRFIPEIRKCVEFQRLNLISQNFGIRQKMDFIFFRNVMIYFDRPTQIKILQKLCEQLVEGGFLFTGHSENLFQTNLPLVQIQPSVFQKKSV